MKVNLLENNRHSYLVLLEPNNDPFKTRLMEKKQQQWKQENCIA
jgi:hypothetical protein